MDPITQLFDRMDDWRHFPNYQLERRADIFFCSLLTRGAGGQAGRART